MVINGVCMLFVIGLGIVIMFLNKNCVDYLYFNCLFRKFKMFYVLWYVFEKYDIIYRIFFGVFCCKLLNGLYRMF